MKKPNKAEMATPRKPSDLIRALHRRAIPMTLCKKMKSIAIIMIAAACLISCDKPTQPMEYRAQHEEPAAEVGAFEGDLSFDAAFDELDTIVVSIAERNDELVKIDGFSSVDVPSVRANIAILVNLISTFDGGGSNIGKSRLNQWERSIMQCFDDPERWGFQPWPQDEKDAWRQACQADVDQLRMIVSEDWDEP